MVPVAAFLLLGGLWGCPTFEPRDRLVPALRGQEIEPFEEEEALRAKDVLLEVPSVDMVLMLRRGRYEAWSKRGFVAFIREPAPMGWSYRVVEVGGGGNPLERQDPTLLATLEEELAAGANPNRQDYRDFDPGYRGADDPRMSFVEPESTAFPEVYERIAAYYDSPDAGDLTVIFKPYALFPLGSHVSAHGNLELVQSRAPLIFAGKGVRKGTVVDRWARSVDIAPTVARILGVRRRHGVGPGGIIRDDLFLAWQDGHVLEEVLDPLDPTATRAVIVLNDAMSMTELDHMVATEGSDLPGYRWLYENGIRFRYGQIVNFPSNTFASHNTIGSGAWSGHHGLLDNKYFQRLEGRMRDPYSAVLGADELLFPGVETLHEAVHRSFPNWHPVESPLGNVTASINSPSVRGADVGLLAGVEPIHFKHCPDPPVELPPTSERLGRGQATDDFGLKTFWKLYAPVRGDDGRPARGCLPVPPRFTILNFVLTDDTSHEHGVHSDLEREAIRQTDRRMSSLLAALEQAGVLDETLIVYTSDHGQALQDRSRSVDFRPALDAAGIRYVASDIAIYLNVTVREPDASDGGGTDAGGDSGAPDAGPPLEVRIASPGEGAESFPVRDGEVRAAFNRAPVDPAGVFFALRRESDGSGGTADTVPGRRRYLATDLAATFRPFPVLRPGSRYHVEVQAEGAKAGVSFTTTEAFGGRAADVHGRTYDFHLLRLTYPEELAGLFNSMLGSVPPILFNVHDQDATGTEAGSEVGRMVLVGATGGKGAPRGEAVVDPEGSAAMELSGEFRGRYFSVGPSDLRLSVSGITLVIRNFMTSGSFAADGSSMEGGVLTGLLNVAELGEALHVDLDLCTQVSTAHLCDGAGNIRLAADIEGRPNPIPFTAFITDPPDGAVDVDPATGIEVMFSEPADPAGTNAILVTEDGEAVALDPVWAGDRRSVVLQPTAPLDAATRYSFAVEATSAADPGRRDTRRGTFTTR